jgi:hypothetical protein
VAAWVIAAFWNGISVPAFVGAWQQAASGELERMALVVIAMFPLVGLAIVAMAIRQTLRWRKFGTSTLELKTLPGVVGGPLRAVLHAGARLGEAERVELRLDCVQRVTSGSGDSRSTRETILWQHVREVARGEFAAAGGTQVPVEFTIPYGSAESHPESSDRMIVWRLHAEAAVDGVDYDESFEVPVFVTPESREEVTGDEEAISQILVPPPGLGDAGPRLGSKVRLAPWKGVGRELRFGMLRNPGTSAMLLLFTVFFGGALWLIVEKGAGKVLTGGFGLAVLVLAWATLSVTFGVTRVRAEPGRLHVKRAWLGVLGREHSFATADIHEIRTEQGMQSGENVYWRLRVRTARGTVTAGSRIPDRREAEALARLLRETLGLS